MKLAIASDKSGFVLKEAIRAYLDEQNIPYDDLGTTDVENPSPFFVTAPKIAPLVADGTYDRAILICGTGMGVNILANKHKGVYAAACESVYAAKMSRAINDANILCMGGWVIGPEMGIEMVKAFLETEFLQGLEEWRQTFLTGAKEKVSAIEDGLFG
ncbi:MAG: RpiB/LacA/LacB family sugar-phosphate isomerase [Oscillospiraceae bacterium]|nr:RpiB/LacA/LacB family sugar-phosphate isomerase [Oscillospiraceae bacterium]